MSGRTGPTTGSAPRRVILRLAVIALTLGTAVTHLSLAFPDPAFMLNGLGYLALLAALYLPLPALARHAGVTRRVLIGYTLLTIILWIAFGLRAPIGYLNKLNEVALIAALLSEARAGV